MATVGAPLLTNTRLFLHRAASRTGEEEPPCGRW